MNVCTDQLAMMLADKEQLVSVSWLSRDANYAVLSNQAVAYPVNYGLAEEVFLLKPDLVLAGQYTARPTVDALRRLGVRVETFGLAQSFEQIEANTLRMGEILGRKANAEQLVQQMRAQVDALKTLPPVDARLAHYQANAYVSGAGTLTHEVIALAGLTNLGAELGFSGLGKLPLELLIAHQPDVLLNTAGVFGGPALAHGHLTHPAYRALAADAQHVELPGGLLACGTPLSIAAAQQLRQAVSDE